MKKKKDKKELFKKTVDVVKKSSETERKKSEEKKLKKKNKPKGMGAKKLGMIAFWVLFSFMFLVTTVSIFGGGSSVSVGEVKEERNKLFDHEGLEFARSFVHEYFTWSTDRHGRERRIANLERYFIDGIDDLGGVAYDDEWESSIDKRNIILKDIQEINEEQARYTFKVNFTMRSETEDDDTEVDADNLSFEELLEEKQKMKVVNGYRTKESERYISIPVYYNDKINRFAIFDLPSFTYINEGEPENDLDNDLLRLDTLSDGYTENNVSGFLNTFFESYSRDGRDKLSYILEDEQHQDGLNGTMEFSSIEDVTIYQADDNNNTFIAESEVVLKDPSTELEFTNKFLLVIQRKDQRYVVESLNNERYVSELIEAYIAEQEDGEEEAEEDLETMEDESDRDYEYQNDQENNYPLEDEVEELEEVETNDSDDEED